MGNCTNCAKAIFDALWGEHKCSITQLVMYAPEKMIDCSSYKEGTPMESKANADYYLEKES